VAGEAVLAHQPADPTAERVPGDTGRRDQASGGGEAVRLRLVVDFGPYRAAADICPPGGGVDADVVHRAEIDHDPPVDGREAGDAVAAAADRDRQLVGPPESARCA